MLSSISAEMLKLRKRTASWVLIFVLILLVVLIGYTLLYLSIQNPPSPEDLGFSTEEAQAFEESIAESDKEFLNMLLPKKVLVNVLSMVSLGGGFMALIFGALAFGSEYSWGTLKTVLSRRPGKSKVLVGKILVALSYFALFSMLALVVGGVCSYFVASLEDMPVRWPSAWRTVKALGAGWLIFAVWGMLGAFLATFLRSSSLAIGIGLGYAVVIEQTAVSFSASVKNELFRSVVNSLPGTNSAVLANAFGNMPQGFSTAVGDSVGAQQATIVLGSYVVVFAAFAVLLFWRRDID